MENRHKNKESLFNHPPAIHLTTGYGYWHRFSFVSSGWEKVRRFRYILLQDYHIGEGIDDSH